MPKQKSPKARALDKLATLGWTAGDVERVLIGQNRRFDLFGILDIVAVKGPKTLGLQVTVPDRLADHVYKMQAEPRLVKVLAAGWSVEVWGIRNEVVSNGSWAVTRSFEKNPHGGPPLLFDGSDVIL